MFVVNKIVSAGYCLVLKDGSNFIINNEIVLSAIEFNEVIKFCSKYGIHI